MPLFPAEADVLSISAKKTGGVFDVVKDFKAAGDNVTDDTAAIKAALTEASLVAGEVYVPSNTYKTTSVLTVPPGVTLRGNGVGSVIRCLNVTADPSTGEKSAITIGRGSSARVIGLKLDGASTAQIGVEVTGYNDGQIQNLSVVDVDVTGFTVAGVKMRGGYRYKFDRCRIYSNAIGVWVPGTGLMPNSVGQIDFHSCWVHDNTAEGVYFQAGSIINFFGGNVENNGTYGFRLDPSASGQLISEIGIYGVSIEANHTMGILTHDFTQGVTCLGCQFTSSGLQPKAWQLDGGGGGNHFFANNFQQAHATASSDASSNSVILPGRIFSETYPSRGNDWREGNLEVLTFSASITPDASVGQNHQITSAVGTAFTINNPTNLAGGQVVRIQIRNQSAGALGAATWGSKYKLVGGAWTQPGAFSNRWIEFVYDAGNDKLYEVARSSGDIAN